MAIANQPMLSPLSVRFQHRNAAVCGLASVSEHHPSNQLCTLADRSRCIPATSVHSALPAHALARLERNKHAILADRQYQGS